MGIKEVVQSVMAPKGKIPPQATDMEQAVLGSLMVDKNAVDLLPSALTGECFYKEGHRLTFEAMMELARKREPIDLLTVKHILSTKGELEKAGGIFYLTELTSRVASAAHLQYHAKVVIEKYILREIIKVGDKMVQDGFADTTDPFEALTLFRNMLDDIEPAQDSGTTLLDAIEQSEEDIERAMKGDYVSLKPGYSNMEGVMYEPGEVIVVGGDTGSGKTAWGFGFAMGMNRNGLPVFYNSLEMKPKELAKRVMASYAAKKIWHIRTGKMDLDDWQSWQHLKAHKKFEIRSCRTSDQLFSAIRKFRKRFGLKDNEPILVVNDYLQLMTGVGGTMEEKVSQLSHAMKEYAMDENALVINLSQMSRGSLNNEKKKPTKDGLKYAGSIEQDADYIYLLYRPEYYGIMAFEDGTSAVNKGELIEAKMRNGFTRRFDDQLKFAFMHGLWLPEDEVHRLFNSPQQDLFPEPIRPPSRYDGNEFSDNIERFNDNDLF